MKTAKKLLAILLIAFLAAALPGAAQNAIEKSVVRLEKNPKTEYSVYSEKRDPVSHDVIESKKVIILGNVPASETKALAAAFDKERRNATETEMTSGPNKVYALCFVEPKTGRVSRYTLIYRHGTPQVLVVETSAPRRRARATRTACIPEPAPLPFSIML